MAMATRPSWATHIVSAPTAATMPDEGNIRKNYWYCDTGTEIKVQRSDDMPNYQHPALVVTIDSNGSLSWWRRNIRIERELPPIAFIAQLDADNEGIDQLKTLDEVLELTADEALEWLKAHRGNVALVPRKLNQRIRHAFHEAHERFEDGGEIDGCPDDQWNAMIKEWENEKI